MAREGISKAQVFNAADAISAAGQNPTVAGVRAKIGTGSFTTITAFLREWKEQALNQEADEAVDVPEEVTQALGRAAEIVWKAANEHFARELAALRKAADEHALAYMAEAHEAAEEIHRLERENLDQSERINSLLHNVSQAEDLFEQQAKKTRHLAQELGEMRAAAKAADARIKEQAELLRRLVPEKETGSKPKRTRRPTIEPEADSHTKPMDL